MRQASVSGTLFLSCAGVLVLSCGWRESRAHLQVDVIADSGRIRFSTSRCDGRSGPAEINLLEVVEEVAPDRQREKCAVSREVVSSRTLPRSWRMADPVPGFVIEGCDPLSPGDYFVSVRGSGLLGMRRFRVESDGQVQMKSRSCP
jgi:hypothetical protein